MKDLLCQAYVLQLLNGSFSAGQLSRKTEKSYGHVSRELTKIQKQGLVKQISKKQAIGSGKCGLKGFAPSEYQLTAKGRSCFTVVLTGGVFDILHPGHVGMLWEARSHGDVVIAVVARDLHLKEKSPVISEQDRLAMIDSLKPVDAAILGSESSYLDTIRKVCPDVIAIGYDQEDDLKRSKGIITRNDLSISLVRLSRSDRELSTSKILSMIKGSYPQ